MTSGLDNIVDHSGCGGVKCYLPVLDKVLVGLDFAVNVKKLLSLERSIVFLFFCFQSHRLLIGKDRL